MKRVEGREDVEQSERKARRGERKRGACLWSSMEMGGLGDDDGRAVASGGEGRR